MTRILLLSLSLTPLLACNNHSGSDADGSLSAESVSNIPAGDAKGSQFTAEYRLEIVTVDCSGSCGPVDYDGWTITLCDVGHIDEENVDVEHTDGELVVTGDNSLFVSRQRGGIDVDGSFEVGGYATELGGKVKMTSTASGSIEEDGTFEALARAHVWGRYDDASVDCWGTYETSGGFR